MRRRIAGQGRCGVGTRERGGRGGAQNIAVGAEGGAEPVEGTSGTAERGEGLKAVWAAWGGHGVCACVYACVLGWVGGGRDLL